jgi:hypothetical protein
VTIYLISARYSAGADLNAPVEQPRVTMATEVDRGMSACPDFLNIDVTDHLNAVYGVENTNKQRNTNTKPFQFGLYYLAWHRVWSQLNFGIPKEKTARDLEIAHVALLFAVTKALREQLGLSVEDVRTLAGIYYEPNEDERFPALLKTKQFKGSMLSGEEKARKMARDSAGKK